MFRSRLLGKHRCPVFIRDINSDPELFVLLIWKGSNDQFLIETFSIQVFEQSYYIRFAGFFTSVSNSYKGCCFVI